MCNDESRWLRDESEQLVKGKGGGRLGKAGKDLVV